MTSSKHTRATTRTAEAIEHIETKSGEKADVIVMVQGDEPLISPDAIAATLEHFNDPSIKIVNIMSRLSSYDHFIDKNNVKVAVNQKNDALYFSREPIPSPWQGVENVPMYMQTGIIAFRHDTLQRFNKMEETRLEQIESVDMNRFMEHGYSIRMIESEFDSHAVDNLEDLHLVTQLIKEDPLTKQYLNTVSE